MTFCEVWVADSEGLPLSSEWLPDGEVRRLADLTDRTARRASWTAQLLLRLALSRRLGGTPAQVPLLRYCPHCDSRQHGPLLVPGSGLAVSVAHSGTLVVAAVSNAEAVGVDVECVSPTSPALAAPLLDVAFSAREKESLLALPESIRERAVCRQWTRKEAVLKASGDGVLGSLSDVKLTGVAPSRFVAHWPIGSSGHPYWVTDLDLGRDGVVGSICLTAKRSTITALDGDVALRGELRRWDGSGRPHEAESGR